MRLLHKIAALVVLAAALPLATVGFLLVRLNEQALEREVSARFDQTARHAAEAVDAEIAERAHLLARTGQAIPWTTLSDEETRGALELLARQLGGRAAASYPLGGPPLARYREPGLPDDPLPRAPPLDEQLLKSSAWNPGDVHLSAVFAAAGKPRVIASAHCGERVIAVEVPLDGAVRRLSDVQGGESLSLLLAEGDGHVIAAVPPTQKLGDKVNQPIALGPHRYTDGGRAMLGARAYVGAFGWSVTVSQEAAVALAAPRAMRRLTLLGTGAATLAALALAFLFARRLTAALSRLAAGARAIAAGNLSHRVAASGTDEVAELGVTFDKMGEQLATSRAEIEAWNRELEARVAARTEELRQAQAQLVEAQKLAALGQLGAGVAHEINNPLGGVIGHVQLLLSDRPPGHADHEALKHIEEAARKASSVVGNLLRFSVQRRAPVYTYVDLNKIVRDTLSLTESLIRDGGVTLELALDAANPRVYGDAGQLGQVLLNLVSNARTATPKGGRLTVRTAPADAGASFTVEDTGKGISPEHKPRIFEPFFTTKDEWSNVGLGLSVSFRIVSEHRGKITVDSELGQGARFTVFVPATPPEAAA